MVSLVLGLGHHMPKQSKGRIDHISEEEPEHVDGEHNQ